MDDESVKGKRFHVWFSQNLNCHHATLQLGILGGEGRSEAAALDSLADELEYFAAYVRARARNRRLPSQTD